MKLYLIQHGQALSKEENPKRPLSENGKTDVEKIAKFLNQTNLDIHRLLHSEKLRARQTAEILANILNLDIEIESCGIINPNDDPRAFVWQDDSWQQNMLVVGHLPFLSKLVSFLIIENEDLVIAHFLNHHKCFYHTDYCTKQAQ